MIFTFISLEMILALRDFRVFVLKAPKSKIGSLLNKWSDPRAKDIRSIYPENVLQKTKKDGWHIVDQTLGTQYVTRLMEERRQFPIENPDIDPELPTYIVQSTISVSQYAGVFKGLTLVGHCCLTYSNGELKHSALYSLKKIPKL
jgi:hypothetical protein